MITKEHIREKLILDAKTHPIHEDYTGARVTIGNVLTLGFNFSKIAEENLEACINKVLEILPDSYVENMGLTDLVFCRIQFFRDR